MAEDHNAALRKQLAIDEAFLPRYEAGQARIRQLQMNETTLERMKETFQRQQNLSKQNVLKGIPSLR